MSQYARSTFAIIHYHLNGLQLVQLALKLHPTRPSQWPHWVLSTIAYFSGLGVSTEHLLEFLAIVPEEIRTSDLLNATKLVLLYYCFGSSK